MSSAQLDLQPLDEAAAETEAEVSVGLKEQVAERLAAHRARRTQRAGGSVTPIAPPAPARVRSTRIAAAVAERYAHSQTYRDFLAAEAERAIHEAEAAAEVAAISAHAVAEAQYQLLAELDQWTPPQPEPATPETTRPASTALETGSAGLSVRLYEDATPIHIEPLTAATRGRQSQEQIDEAEGLALDEEIAFRQSPVFEEPLGPPIDIPANLIEFPRQLVAPRKARPRLAEGPLREDDDQPPQQREAAQLRIFEVESTQISTEPILESVEPEWSSILLSALPAAAAVESTEPLFNPLLPPQVAPISLRLMAGIVDGCILLASLLAFIAVFAITVGKLADARLASQIASPMPLQTAAISATVVLGFLALLYHLLFFTLAEATPGMRYARVGLCTFSDENPTRSAMRRRLFAMILSACPLGIGFLWACLDEDRLGWHDRISHMYQRSY
jgi:uncharacterized RDD family membrane protein YckC